jgi:hypothetical protein
MSDSGRIPVGGHWETLSRATATLCDSAGLGAGCLVSMLQRPIVKAKKCVPAARRTMGKGVVRSTALHCRCILTEQTPPALATVKMEVAGGDCELPLESAIRVHVPVLSHGDFNMEQHTAK